MQHLEVSGAVRPIYGSLGIKWLRAHHILHVSRLRVKFQLLPRKWGGVFKYEVTLNYFTYVKCTEIGMI
jgi:hypothetical protein